ncbi:hypothetical protein KKE78_04845 [Patescibacteria group bacterium]|nr:hypothetical protein [Patescibacteria group bacterium]
MYKKKIKLASVIITYNRISEARAQMDIIKEAWQPLFGSINIYHEFNGEKKWYPKKYREDFLHRHRSMSHLVGATYMLNQGIKHVLESGKKYDYIIATSADVWFYDSDKLKRIIKTCQEKRFQLATSLWGLTVLATEFFIITPELAKKVFPLKYTQRASQYRLIEWIHLSKIAIFEAIFTLKIMRVLKNPNKIYLIPGRRTVWPKNRYHSANFYASHHDQHSRKKNLIPKIRTVLGSKIENMPSLNKFLFS